MSSPPPVLGYLLLNQIEFCVLPSTQIFAVTYVMKGKMKANNADIRCLKNKKTKKQRMKKMHKVMNEHTHNNNNNNINNTYM